MSYVRNEIYSALNSFSISYTLVCVCVYVFHVIFTRDYFFDGE